MQRKRHINFKDFLSTFGSILDLEQRIRKSNLHSIPKLSSSIINDNKEIQYGDSNNLMKNNLKSNVLYSIPCVKSCAHFCKYGVSMALSFVLTIICGLTLNAVACYAINDTNLGPAPDVGTITPLPSGTTTPATASLSLSNPNMTSSAITPGNTTTVSTNVSVSVGNAESYSLVLSVDSSSITNGSTTLVAGNVVNDNTWGYKWDNASSYTAPSTSGTTLTNLPALDSNGSVNFTKNLTFGAKFSTNAEAGHYKGSGTLSLVATPKATTYTLADLTQMQQLSLAPEACVNTPYLSGLNYSAEYTLTDVRDNNTYTIRKFGDGKCWMTQNLKLSNTNKGGSPYPDGRILKSDTSDVSTNWTLPASSISGFSSNTASNAYVSGNTGYYTWCAATAGTCSSATSSGTNATSSICPKGWKLPTGGTSGNTDFYNLFKNMGLSISGSLSATSNTSWGTGDLAIAQGSPYNFAYTGRVNSGALDYTTSYGFWWSRTTGSSIGAYILSVTSSYVSPGTTNDYRYFGYAVRCVAK